MINDSKPRATFITTYNGVFVRRVSAGTAGANERVNKLGETVFEKQVDDVSGFLVDIKKDVHDTYGASWNIKLADASGVTIIQLGYTSHAAAGFFKKDA